MPADTTIEIRPPGNVDTPEQHLPYGDKKHTRDKDRQPEMPPQKPHDRKFYLASPDHFVLNAGHTDSEELKPLTHSLLDEGVATVIEENGQKYMVLDNEKTADFLARHQKDQPHAVAAVCTLISEELDQLPNPKRHINSLKSGEEEIDQASAKNDEELVDELRDDITFYEDQLRETLSIVPGQQLAVCDLLQNFNSQSAISSYLDSYGSTPRLDLHGRPVSQTIVVEKLQNDTDGKQEVKKEKVIVTQTYGLYLNGLLENIKTTLLRQKDQITDCFKDIELLRERKISLPPEEKVHAISVG